MTRTRQKQGARGHLGGSPNTRNRAKLFPAHVHVTVSVEQRAKLVALAGGMSLSEYVRKLIDNQPTKEKR